MSKGSGRRPSSLTEQEWENRWDAIFGRDDKNWPFPNKPLDTEPLDKLPFNPDNEEEAPL